jgi:hypothetical protein
MRLLKCLTIVWLIEICGCSPSLDSYVKTVRNGIKTVPHVQEMMKMFPDVPLDNFITQYGFDKSVPVTWNTVAYIYGRYELRYHVEVMVDYKENRISEIRGVRGFYLGEVATVSKPTLDGTIEVRYASNSKIKGVFGEMDWDRIVATKGDFSVIGIHLITNSPIPGFNDYVDKVRKDMIQVSP